jgi:centromeric protein E
MRHSSHVSNAEGMRILIPVFSDGQKGTGKTHTIRGSEDEPGIVPLCIRDIFDYVDSHNNLRYTIKLSCYEIYNEMIIDLLGDNQQLVLPPSSPLSSSPHPLLASLRIFEL